MTRLKILLALLALVMVSSSCSRKYGNLTRRSKAQPVLVQKTDRSDVKFKFTDTRETEPAAIPVSEDNAAQVEESTQAVATESAVELLQPEQERAVKSAIDLIREGNEGDGKDKMTAKKLLAKGPLGPIKQVNKLRKEMKAARDTPGQKDDLGTLLYIILVVILILLILSLLGKLFGGWFVNILLLVLLIVLIIWLLGRM